MQGITFYYIEVHIYMLSNIRFCERGTYNCRMDVNKVWRGTQKPKIAGQKIQSLHESEKKYWSTKHYTEIQRLSIRTPTQNRGGKLGCSRRAYNLPFYLERWIIILYYRLKQDDNCSNDDSIWDIYVNIKDDDAITIMLVFQYTSFHHTKVDYYDSLHKASLGETR
jgi:hypothetical protein